MKQQKELVVLVLLLLIAGNIWYWFFFRHKTSAPASAVAVTQNYNRLLSVENPAPHTDRREAARKSEYKSNGRNPFSPIAPPPPSQTPGQGVKRKEPSGPQVEPPPPALTIPANMHFFGYGTVPNGTARRAFFTDGEDVYIVSAFSRSTTPVSTSKKFLPDATAQQTSRSKERLHPHDGAAPTNGSKP